MNQKTSSHNFNEGAVFQLNQLVDKLEAICKVVAFTLELCLGDKCINRII